MVACGLLCLSLVLLATLQLTLCAPRTRNNGKVPQTQTIYDQKQTGDYNIQFHLKDFQIIALVPDDASLGDYDYSYDYADFTVKPSTQKPSEPPLTPSTQSSTPSSTILEPSTTSSRPYVFFTPEELPSSSNSLPVKEVVNSTSSDIVESSSESAVTQKTAKLEDPFGGSPGKIKVQIVETSGGVVPGEDVQNDVGGASPQRKCAAGFTRDKRGRCRRVRKPATGSTQLFGFSRLASSLASRFNQHNPPESSPSSPSSSVTSLEPIVE